MLKKSEVDSWKSDRSPDIWTGEKVKSLGVMGKWRWDEDGSSMQDDGYAPWKARRRVPWSRALQHADLTENSRFDQYTSEVLVVLKTVRWCWNKPNCMTLNESGVFLGVNFAVRQGGHRGRVNVVYSTLPVYVHMRNPWIQVTSAPDFQLKVWGDREECFSFSKELFSLMSCCEKILDSPPSCVSSANVLTSTFCLRHLHID